MPSGVDRVHCGRNALRRTGRRALRCVFMSGDAAQQRLHWACRKRTGCPNVDLSQRLATCSGMLGSPWPMYRRQISGGWPSTGLRWPIHGYIPTLPRLNVFASRSHAVNRGPSSPSLYHIIQCIIVATLILGCRSLTALWDKRLTFLQESIRGVRPTCRVSFR